GRSKAGVWKPPCSPDETGRQRSMCLMWHLGAVAAGAPVLDVLRGLGTGNVRPELRRRDFNRMWALRGQVACSVGRSILNRWRRHRVQGVLREKALSPEIGVGPQPLL